MIAGGTAVACTFSCTADPVPPTTEGDDAPPSTDSPVDANSGIDSCAQATVSMHDTYAQALYLDGTLGPLTGVVEVASVIAATTITQDFWHGHGGVQHQFTVEPAHFVQLMAGQRVTLGTTTVEGHSHTLFIDPVSENYRVPGAPDVEVPLGHC